MILIQKQAHATSHYCEVIDIISSSISDAFATQIIYYPAVHGREPATCKAACSMLIKLCGRDLWLELLIILSMSTIITHNHTDIFEGQNKETNSICGKLPASSSTQQGRGEYMMPEKQAGYKTSFREMTISETHPRETKSCRTNDICNLPSFGLTKRKFACFKVCPTFRSPILAPISGITVRALPPWVYGVPSQDVITEI